MESLLFGIQQSQPRSSQRRWIARLNDLWVIISLIRLRVGVIPCVSSLIESEAIQGRLIPPDRACVIPRGAFLIMTDDHDHKKTGVSQVNLIKLIYLLVCLRSDCSFLLGHLG